MTLCQIFWCVNAKAKNTLLWFLVHEYTFKSIFPQKKFPEETWLKIYKGQDPDPDQDVFESRIRFWIKIVRIHNTALQ
jgi:hypothetical protein